MQFLTFCSEIDDACDNCPTWNPDQANSDGDSDGNACDPCPFDTSTLDSDSDSVPDACDVSFHVINP